MDEPSDPMDRLFWLVGGSKFKAQVRRLRRALEGCVAVQKAAVTQLDGEAPTTLKETTASAERILRETDE